MSKQAEVVVGDCKDEIDGGTLSSWLCESYFNGERKVEFSEVDIQYLGDLLTRMMRYRPADRLSTREILEHKWFEKNPLAEVYSTVRCKIAFTFTTHRIIVITGNQLHL